MNNPLTGPTGASHIYGPQKGADARMAHELDAALERYRDRSWNGTSGSRCAMCRVREPREGWARD